MHLLHLLATAILTVPAAVSARNHTNPSPKSFQLTAIAGQDGRSVFQCWQLDQQFLVSQQAVGADIS